MQTDLERRAGGALAARAMYILAVLAGLVSLRRFWRNDLDLWPDVVCQTYLGWRLAMGDSLYLTVWDSHPPVAALYSALFHLALPPSVATAKLIVLSTAVLFGLVQAFGTWACGIRSRGLIAAIGVCAAALYAQSIANARSEDFVILLGTLAVFLAIRQSSTPTGNRWAFLAGLAAGLALFAKPAAAAAGIATLLILMDNRDRLRALGAYALGGLVVASAFAVYFLQDDRLAAAYDSIVVYGRIYFRPLTAEVVVDGVRKLASDNFIACALVGAGGLVAGLSIRGGPRLRLGLVVALIAWLLLEAVAALAQTTYFPYVFFPFQACLIGVANIVLSRRMAFAGSTALTIDAATLGAGATGIALVVLWLLRSEIVALHSATLLAGLAVAAAALAVLVHMRWPALRPAWDPRVAAILLLLPCLAVAKHNQSLRKAYFRDYTTRFVEFAARLDRFRSETGSTILWFDPAPTVGYLAAMRQAVPEYVSPPLFYDGYAGETQWRRIDRALPDVNLVLIWKEWLNPLAPEFDLQRYEAYRHAHRQLVEDFDLVASVPLVAGRGPLLVLVRKGTAPGLRADLDVAGFSVAPNVATSL